MNLLAQSIVRKPIVPVLIKDQNTGIIISSLLLILTIYALYRIMNMAYLFPICNKLMGILVSSQELTVWTFLGALYIICTIFTILISKGEK